MTSEQKELLHRKLSSIYNNYDKWKDAHSFLKMEWEEVFKILDYQENVDKYYWICYQINQELGLRQTVSTIHPFELMKGWRNYYETSKDDYVIVSWKEITKKEYDFFNDNNL